MRLGKKSGWSHGCDPLTHCRLGRALTLRFVTLAVRSLSRVTEWCTPVFTGQVLPARTDYTSVTCAACSKTNEMATHSESYSCDWCGALCWFLRFGHCCFRQARVSDDTCKERRPKHERVCGSIEVPFCIVLVHWSGQVRCGSASPFGVVSVAQGLSAQVFRFGDVGPQCSCHVLFGRRGLGCSQKDP